MVQVQESSSHATGADAPTGDEPAADGRPANVPEKFWDTETKSVNQDALLKSYSELEKANTSGLPSDQGNEPASPAPDGDDADAAAKQAEADAKSEKAAEAAGVDIPSLEEEFMRDGKLSDATLSDLKAKGFDEADVNEYIEYRSSKAERYTAELHQEVGGPEKFATMAEWARTSWGETELAEYNAAIDSNDTGRAKLALKGLAADFTKANGSTPKLLTGEGGRTTTGTTYRSDQEMIKDMENPLYKSDPAYRQDVLNKVDRTQKSLGQS
jgi:hypothetical protein